MQVVVLGKEKGQRISELLFKNLLKRYAVTYFNKKGLVCSSEEDSFDILLIQTDNIKRLKSPSCLLVAFEEKSISELEEVSPGMVVLIHSKNLKCRQNISDLGISVISCGMSEKDTLNFSSVGSENSVISLQRELQMGENVIEPMEIKIKHPQDMDSFIMQIFTVIVLLMERGEADEIEINF